MNVRELQKDDVPALAELAAKTFAETFGHSFTPRELETKLKETRSENYFWSVADSDAFLVAVIDHNLVGYIQLSDVQS